MGVLRGEAMDALKGLLERKWVLPVAALVLGIAMGLMLSSSIPRPKRIVSQASTEEGRDNG